MLCSSASGSVTQCTEHQSRQAPASTCTACGLAGPGRAVPEDQGAAARPAGREEARHRRAHRDRVVARDLRPLRHGDRPADVGPAVAGRGPEPHRHAVVRDRLGPQRLREALRTRRGRSAGHARRRRCRSTRRARRAGRRSRRRGRTTAACALRTDQEISTRPRAVRSPRSTSVRGTSVMCTCTRPRCSIAARKTCSTSGLTRTSVVSPDLERARGPGRGQQRALVGDDEVEDRVAVGGHGHVSSRGRDRTSAVP